MDTLSVSLDLKSFQALLGELIDVHFYQPSLHGSRDELVMSRVSSLSELSWEEIGGEVRIFESILRKAADDNWDANTLEAFLADRGMQTEHAQVFVRVWRNNQHKIHEQLLRRASLSGGLANLSWRVDMKAMSKSSSEINKPVAFVEMDLRSKTDSNENNQAAKVAKFEMDREEVQDMLVSLENIMQAFQSISSAQK